MTEKIILNPISNTLKNSIKFSINKLNLAVPYVSGFAKEILTDENVNKITDKRIITRFDETNINTFNLPTLEYLIDKGFEICYNNSIHLKLYITDSETYITSSNLTEGGFEKNFELTVKVDTHNSEDCQIIFDNLWAKSKINVINKNLISQNIYKYNVLKKRQKFENTEVIQVNDNFNVGSLNIQILRDLIFNSKKDYTERLKLTYSANKFRSEIRNKLIANGFDLELFYAPIGHLKRNDSIFYNFAYGPEFKLAGTGLREEQYKLVFEHPEFKNVISYILPESVGLEPWNLNDDKSFFNFCCGLFDFNIPQLSMALPIKLASFFYPDYFVSIFKLDHLQKVCESLGIKTEAKAKGQKLYAYNTFLRKKMNDIPYDNYIKSSMIYEMLYSVVLYKRLENGESFEDIRNSYDKKWIKSYVDIAKVNLENIKAL